MEEGGVVEGADKSHRWIIDPLDGTTNFLHGIPMFSISIALEREGQIVAGLVYNPIADEMFIAEKGQGAFLNDRRIRVAVRRELAQAVVGTGIPHIGRPGHQRFTAELGAVMNEVAGVRRMGSAALDLAWVAAGRLDAYWEANLAAWDVAAGIILVREAGGFVTDLTGRDTMLETGGIIARQRNAPPATRRCAEKSAGLIRAVFPPANSSLRLIRQGLFARRERA